MKTITLLSTVNFSPAQLDKLRAVSPQFDVQQMPNALPADVPAGLREQVEILYGWSKWVTEAHQYPRLKWIQTHTAGVDKLADTPIWRQADVLISSLNGVHATPIAEYALAAMLAFRWKIRKMLAYQQRTEWAKDRWEEFTGPELNGSTLGIIGYGAIGRELARLARALHMRIVAVNRTGERTPQRTYAEPGIGDPTAAYPDAMYRTDQLLAALPQCDFVAVAAPLTPDTRHLINAAALAAMKPTAVLVNIARGPLVDTAALVAALRQQQIAGAMLDVFEQEPLPADSPLWQLDNVILSPHISGFTHKYDDRASDLFAENLRRYLAGAPLLNSVNRETGY